MKKETLQNLLHRYLPEWDESVETARNELGFSFSLSPEERWEWFAAGKHLEVLGRARQQLHALKLPEPTGPYGGLAEYWVCCFYSDHRSHTGLLEYGAIKGPPFLVFPCPSSVLGDSWGDSVQAGRDKLIRAHRLEGENDLGRWFWSLDGASHVGQTALEAVKSLGLPDTYAMAWTCCFLPERARWMADRAFVISERLPQFLYWREFACSEQPKRKRQMAYPLAIQWAEEAKDEDQKTTTMEDLLGRGMNLAVESSPVGNVRMELSWYPELVNLADLRKGVEYAQRYYHEELQRRRHATPLSGLVEEFTNRAKGELPARAQSARARHEAGEATFEQLLCEEALTPEVQQRYHKLVETYGVSPRERNISLRKIRYLRKEVYDRARLWLAGCERKPTVQRRPPWWKDVLPDP